jgi:hypothetical protein
MMMIQLEMKKNHLCLFSVVVGALLSVGPAVARGEVTVTPVGTPVFQLVDSHLYAAPTDSFPSVFPNHFPTRIVHAPPYDQEYANGLANTGYADKEVFSVSEFTSPSAVHLGYALVPQANAPTGATQDYASGPIIPNDILPITVQGDVFLNGAVYEQGAFGSSLPSIEGFDGRSHFVVESWENSDYAPPGLGSLVGDYEYRLTVRDGNNNGFDVLGQFEVVPEPMTLAPLALGVIALTGCARRRRKLVVRKP